MQSRGGVGARKGASGLGGVGKREAERNEGFADELGTSGAYLCSSKCGGGRADDEARVFLDPCRRGTANQASAAKTKKIIHRKQFDPQTNLPKCLWVASMLH